MAAIERGQQPPVLETGNLSPRRDLTDVRDMVAAYLLLMERGRTGEAYNVGTGRDVFRCRRCSTGCWPWPALTVEVRPAGASWCAAADTAVRPRRTPAKLRRETGWAPRYSLDQTWPTRWTTARQP